MSENKLPVKVAPHPPPSTEKDPVGTVYIVVNYKDTTEYETTENLCVLDSQEKVDAWMKENERKYGGLASVCGGYGLGIQKFTMDRPP